MLRSFSLPHLIGGLLLLLFIPLSLRIWQYLPRLTSEVCSSFEVEVAGKSLKAMAEPFWQLPVNSQLLRLPLFPRRIAEEFTK